LNSAHSLNKGSGFSGKQFDGLPKILDAS